MMAGNISIYDADLQYMAVSPSGIPYEKTFPEDVVVMDLDGHVTDGSEGPQGYHS